MVGSTLFFLCESVSYHPFSCTLTHTHTHFPLSVSCQEVCDMTDSSDTTNQLQLSKVTRCCLDLIGCCASTCRPCLLSSPHFGGHLFVCVYSYKIPTEPPPSTGCQSVGVCVCTLVCFQVRNIMGLSWEGKVGGVNSK